MTAAVDHDELNRLIGVLVPVDQERDGLAQASTEANAAWATLAAELATMNLRATEIAQALVAGVPTPRDLGRLVNEAAQIATEQSFAAARVDAAMRYQAAAELAYLGYTYRAAGEGERAAQSAHSAAHSAWAGPALRDDILSQNTRPEQDHERAFSTANLAPLARSRDQATATARQWDELRQVLEGYAVARYGPGLNLAHPGSFAHAIRLATDRALSRYRATLAV
jgi:hypothetical protein